MRNTPCESTPRRFAHTSDFAHSSAMGGATPAAASSALAKRWRSALGITCNLLSDGITISCRNSRAATCRSSRRRSLYEGAHQVTIPTLQCRLSNRGRSGTIASTCARRRGNDQNTNAQGSEHARDKDPGPGWPDRCVLCLGGAAVPQEIKLTLADQNSPTGWGPSHALQPWVK